MSLRRQDVRNDVLGGDPASEAAIENGRRWALGEAVIRTSCEINVFASERMPGEGARAEEAGEEGIPPG